MLAEFKEKICNWLAEWFWIAVVFLVLSFAILTNAKAQPLDANGTQVIGARPHGCPFRYCGCALARYLGIQDSRLNLAANWARLFPRTNAYPGAAAVRSHHVMLLESHVGGSKWIVRDYNSGRGLSRIHVRDVRGFVFVSPTRKMASR